MATLLSLQKCSFIRFLRVRRRFSHLDYTATVCNIARRWLVRNRLGGGFCMYLPGQFYTRYLLLVSQIGCCAGNHPHLVGGNCGRTRRQLWSNSPSLPLRHAVLQRPEPGCGTTFHECHPLRSNCLHADKIAVPHAGRPISEGIQPKRSHNAG
jgi:hypothetical protein